MTYPAAERRLTTVAWLSALLLLAPLSLPLMTGRVFTLDDLSVLHLPLRHVYSDALKTGTSLTWSPLFFSGFYLHGEGQLGAFHPVHLLFYGLLPLRIAFDLEVMFWYAFAFSGLWIFYRGRGLHSGACVLGAMTFACSSSMLLRISQLNMVAVLAHLPWLLAAVDRVNADSPAARRVGFAGLSLAIGSQALLGHPQSMWLCALCAAAYIFWIARSATRRGWWRLGIAVGCGLLLGAAQLLPTLDLLRDSAREVVSREFRMSFSLHPLNLIQLVSPYFFDGRIVARPEERFIHEFGVYGGVVSTAMLLWVALRYRALQRPLIGFAVTVCALGVLLALGPFGGLFELVATLPILGKFRGPARHLVLLHFGLSVVAAVGFDDLIRLLRDRIKPAVAVRWLNAPVALALGAAVLAPVAHSVADGVQTSVTGSLAGVALALVATVLLADAARGRAGALLLIPVLCALDLALWNYSYVWSSPLRTVQEITDGADSPADAAPRDAVSNEIDDARRNLVILDDFKLLTPFVGLPPARRLPASDLRVQQLFGVRWTKAPGGWIRVPDPMLRVRIVSDAVVSANPAASLRDIDIARTALVSADLALGRSQGRTSALVVADAPGRLEVDVDTDHRSLLVTTESFHRGWSASSTTGPLETARAYGDLLAVVVPPGQYRLTLKFDAWSSRVGMIVSLAAMVVLGGMLSLLEICPFVR